MTSAYRHHSSSDPGEPIPLVILSATDDSLPERGTSGAAAMQRAVRMLGARRIPLVWISRAPAAAVLAVQADLELCQPFICDGGAYLYVPRGYFGDLGPLGTPAGDWDVVAFTARHDAGRAVQLLVSLFRVGAPAAVIVGLAQETTDVAVLEQVDVPVIVRSSHRDPTALLRTFPHAYLTNAVGADGWREAVLGQRTE